jgi:predicted CDP-diglyceride synthetase/phosphatidate cytidylyltransferase
MYLISGAAMCTPTPEYILVPVYCRILFVFVTVCDVLKDRMGNFIHSTSRIHFAYSLAYVIRDSKDYTFCNTGGVDCA